MYVIAILVSAGYLLLGIAARRERADANVSWLLRPFYRRAGWIYKKACIHKISCFESIQVKKDLERLYPGEGTDLRQTEYYVKKTSLMLMVLLTGTLLGAAVKFQADEQGKIDVNGTIYRGSASEGVRQLVLEARIGKGFSDRFRIDIYPKQMSRDEAEELEKEFWKLLSVRILGSNESLEEVNSDLQLVQELEGFPFQVEWSSTSPDVLGIDGSVYDTGDSYGMEAGLIAVVQYGAWEWTHRITVFIVPPAISRQKEISREVENLLEKAQEEEPYLSQWQLPLEWEGQNISWKKYVEDNSLIFWGMAAAAALCIYFLMDKDLHDQMLQRGRQMSSDYPLIVNKMVLYLGAGMTVRAAFQKIAGNYQRMLKEGTGKQPAYEEMVYTCHELQTGIAEGAAYERFGKRTGIQEYIRFSALLSQNLKKGNSTLVQRLREEACKAMQEEKNRQKKAGEEASTKLLVPMIIMLAIVMVLVMIPAFSSLGM